MSKNWFTVAQTSNSGARRGVIQTAHGMVQTPAFAPDATYAAVRLISGQDLQELGLQIILGNSYHIGIRPGVKLIDQFGGLHKFMSWNQPVITDSGGYQAFSLVYQRKMGRILDEGVLFRDHMSGDQHLLTPQKSIENQLRLNSDILVVLDYPVAPDANEKDNTYSVERTTEWAKLCKQTFERNPRSQDKTLIAVVQGANNQALRQHSFEELAAMGFDGYAFGGPPENDEVVAYTANLMPEDQPRYMMGSGTPQDIVKYVGLGYDLFDCVIPTRNARHGLLYTSQGKLRITNQNYQQDPNPVDPQCHCELCTTYSRAYLHHLFNISEILGQRLATIHNLTYYMWLMRSIRESLEQNNFDAFSQMIKEVYSS